MGSVVNRHELVLCVPLEGAGAAAGEIAIGVNESTYAGFGSTDPDCGAAGG